MLTITASPTSRDNARGLALRFCGRVVADRLSLSEASRLAKGVRVAILAEALSAFEMTPEDCPTWQAAFDRLYAASRACGYRPGSHETVSQFASRTVKTHRGLQ